MKPKTNLFRPHLFMVLLVLLQAPFGLVAQDFSKYARDKFISGNDTLPYRILYPENYNPKKKYPLVVFLHGTGERGIDNENQLKWGGDFFLQDSVRKKYPAIVVFPQCPEKYRWTTINGQWDFKVGLLASSFQGGIADPPGVLTIKLIESMIKSGKVDSRRVYIGGLSMGGFGVFSLVSQNPKLFAAAFPICGGGDLAIVEQFNAKTAWWLFNGAEDNVIDPDFSRNFYKAMTLRKLNVSYTEYPGVKHDSWVNAFKEPMLLKWLFEKKL